MAEKRSRRPEFTEGPEFEGPDGSTWHLPILTVEHYDRHEAVRDFVASNNLAVDDPADLNPFDPDRAKTRVIALHKMLVALLNENYYLALGDVVELMIGSMGTGCTAPIMTLLTAYSELAFTFACIQSADDYGTDRQDQIALIKTFSYTTAPLYGWGDHDGVMFDN